MTITTVIIAVIMDNVIMSNTIIISCLVDTASIISYTYYFAYILALFTGTIRITFFSECIY